MYDLNLLETKFMGTKEVGRKEITRVPGGWIIRIYDYDTVTRTFTKSQPVFVPFNNEFQKVD